MTINYTVSFGETKEDREARMEKYRKTSQDAILRQEKDYYKRHFADSGYMAKVDAFIKAGENVKTVESETSEIAPKHRGKNIFSKLVDKIKRNK